MPRSRTSTRRGERELAREFRRGEGELARKSWHELPRLRTGFRPSLRALLVGSILLCGCSADAWLTEDQQGRRLLERGDAAAAAEHFADPAWRGVAAYRAGDYGAAIDALARIDDADSAFNSGNAQAHAGQLELAVQAFERALTLRPDWTEARENRDIVQGILDAEAEEPEEEGEPQDPTFKADEVRFDEKGDQGKRGEIPRTALTDEAIAEMWLRAIDPSPAQFLRQKFAMQAAQGDVAEEEGP